MTGGFVWASLPLRQRARPDRPMCLAIPGKVVETYREHDMTMGKIDFNGVCKRACLEHIPNVKLGDYVLVHVGFALARIDEAEARQVFDFLEGINQLDDLKTPE
jgi:hydrogenase expression/formation protein HypC